LHIESLNPPIPYCIQQLLGYIQCFDHEDTKVKFIHYYFESIQKQGQELTEKEKQAIQSLTFDSDIQAILNKSL
jgi:hypothetical protein